MDCWRGHLKYLLQMSSPYAHRQSSASDPAQMDRERWRRRQWPPTQLEREDCRRSAVDKAAQSSPTVPNDPMAST